MKWEKGVREDGSDSAAIQVSQFVPFVCNGLMHNNIHAYAVTE